MSKEKILIIGIVGMAIVLGVIAFGPLKPVINPKVWQGKQQVDQKENQPNAPQRKPLTKEELAALEKIKQDGPPLKLSNLKDNQTVSSPLTIKGQARGQWFFEGTFPIMVIDEKGIQLGQGIARAKGKWQTEDFVSFEATISYARQAADKGLIVFQKDNPSGLEKNAAAISIPVTFAAQKADKKSKATSLPQPPPPIIGCRPTGCSRQICADTDQVSTCEYLLEYACYQTAKCEKQVNGKCGWTQTPQLTQCIEDAKKIKSAVDMGSNSIERPPAVNAMPTKDTSSSKPPIITPFKK